MGFEPTAVTNRQQKQNAIADTCAAWIIPCRNPAPKRIQVFMDLPNTIALPSDSCFSRKTVGDNSLDLCLGLGVFRASDLPLLFSRFSPEQHWPRLSYMASISFSIRWTAELAGRFARSTQCITAPHYQIS